MSDYISLKDSAELELIQMNSGNADRCEWLRVAVNGNATGSLSFVLLERQQQQCKIDNNRRRRRRRHRQRGRRQWRRRRRQSKS